MALERWNVRTLKRSAEICHQFVEKGRYICYNGTADHQHRIGDVIMPVDRRLQATNHHPLATGQHDPGFVSQKNLDMGSGSWDWHPRTVFRGERLGRCTRGTGAPSTKMPRLVAVAGCRFVTRGWRHLRGIWASRITGRSASLTDSQPVNTSATSGASMTRIVPCRIGWRICLSRLPGAIQPGHTRSGGQRRAGSICWAGWRRGLQAALTPNLLLPARGQVAGEGLTTGPRRDVSNPATARSTCM